MRLTNDPLARILHNSLYERMLRFCEVYTPELPAEPVVQTWLQRLFNNDLNLQIHVTLDANYKILSHAVIDIQEAFGQRVIYCHQALADKGNTIQINEAMELLDKLALEINASCIIFTVTKTVKGLEKKYGYTPIRTIMMKCVGGDNEINP